MAYLNSVSNQNSCFKDIFTELKHSLCEELIEDQQARVALAMTNCLLLKSNKDIHPCDDTVEFTTCTESLHGDVWNTYSTFFTHV